MISHLKRRFGIFAALAVLTSVCAAVSIVTVSPVSAAPATTAITALTIDDVADYSACPASASIPSAGFTDTTDSAVDCLAYYGITLGTTATTYEPTASVSRWQMALYITRAHAEAGGTLGTGADQGFTDISGKSAEIQTAINQIKQLGVTVGKTARHSRLMTTSPVRRWHCSSSVGLRRSLLVLVVRAKRTPMWRSLTQRPPTSPTTVALVLRRR